MRVSEAVVTPPPDGPELDPTPRPGRSRLEPVAFPHSRAELPVRGERVLLPFDAFFLRIDRLVDRVIPPALNPFTHTGAIANTALLVALVSGLLLLFWYSPSVHQAYASIAAIERAPWTAGLLRSIHRYSSDGCMFFVGIHALKLFFARRFGGARWVAWVTGLAAVGLLWLTGWLGYWLVWDERARQVALETSRLLDSLPIFADPPSRAFLVDAQVSSMLFFVVFFAHMLLPLAMALALLLHISRVSRPAFLTGRALTAWTLASLVLLSLLLPATSAAPARMATAPRAFSFDAWYLLPAVLGPRLGTGAIWALLLVGGVVLFSVPWWMARGRARPVEVDVARCNACTRCYQDCPYNAVTMVPRTDGKRFEVQSQIDPARCVGCGICVASCNTGAMDLPWLALADQRERISSWIDAGLARDDAPLLAFTCAEATGGLEVDDEGRSPMLPGYRVLELPCAGWLHMSTIERALKHGARGVLVAACSPGACKHREGATWTAQRLRGAREPELRTSAVDPARARRVEIDRTGTSALRAEAARFRRGAGDLEGEAGGGPPGVGAGIDRPSPSRRRSLLAGVALASILGMLTLGAAALPYVAPARGPELVVSFKHPGKTSDVCRAVSAAEQADLPVHMRQATVCERRRADVRLRVRVDGHEVLLRSYPPGGLWGDGSSSAIERLPVSAGDHRVEVALDDTVNPAGWAFVDARTLRFSPGMQQVITFDRSVGFAWH